MSAPQQEDLDASVELLDAEDALEEVEDAEGDVAMDSDDAEDADDALAEITVQNDSVAYFDQHKSSVFAIAQHPTLPSLIATGGSEGEAVGAPGRGYVFDTSAVAGRPLLPASYDAEPGGRSVAELRSLFAIEGHTDSVTALAFTLPRGEFLLSGGMDGKLRVYRVAIDGRNQVCISDLPNGEVEEVLEVNWLAPCPALQSPNTVALGSADGSVWVYTIDGTDQDSPLRIVQSYFKHTGSCTAGAWSPDGQFLATVSDDSSLHVWDVWGEAASHNQTNDNGQTVVSLTASDQRFEVDGGLFSVAIAPKSAFVAVGGGGGAVRIVSLPRVSAEPSSQAHPHKQSSKAKGKGGEAGGSQGGVILAALQAQTDGIETLSFSPGPQTLLAAGSVDGSIAIYDTARSFAVRRHIKEAHGEYSVVKVEFVRGLGDGWLLTSCGMDGVVRRWDARGATASGNVSAEGAAGLGREWRGHRGVGHGGVLGFVQGVTGERIVTAGDDGLVLVFEV